MQSLVTRGRLFLLTLLLVPLAGFAPQTIAQVAPEAAFAMAISQFGRARQGDADQLEPAIAAFRAAPGNPALQPLYRPIWAAR